MQGLSESEVWVVGSSDLTQRPRAKAQRGETRLGGHVGGRGAAVPGAARRGRTTCGKGPPSAGNTRLVVEFSYLISNKKQIKVDTGCW